ncbi:MAG: metal ABC transporter ATP-binding protein [Chlamydiales bacterium]|nr:metal ABC transporter ATP-binding protein [Chlamydiales bacterium]
MTQALLVENLTVYYHTTPVVWDVSLSIPKHHLVGIIGPNGAGKSTFVKALLGLVKSTSGRILFFNQKIDAVRKKVAYIPQRNSVDWQFPITAFDVVLMGCYQRLGWLKLPKAKDKEDTLAMMDKLQMKEFATRQIGELSGGQQQRLFIARALMQQADMYFFDEPFTGIDLTTEIFLIELFKQLVKEGKTIFVVHHDLTKVKKFFDWAVLLNTRLIAYGPMKDVFSMENLRETYENKEEILERALMLSSEKMQGY